MVSISVLETLHRSDLVTLQHNQIRRVIRAGEGLQFKEKDLCDEAMSKLSVEYSDEEIYNRLLTVLLTLLSYVTD